MNFCSHFFLFFFLTNLLNLVICLRIVPGRQQRPKLHPNESNYPSFAQNQITFSISIIIFGHCSNKWHVFSILFLKIADFYKNRSKIGCSHSFFQIIEIAIKIQMLLFLFYVLDLNMLFIWVQINVLGIFSMQNI